MRSPLDVPGGACDAHQHVIGDPAVYPMVASRGYTPPQAPLTELEAMHARLGLQRAVLVQPSFYGTDNSCLLDALSRLGPSSRGIVVIGDGTSDDDLARMARLGVRGIRINQSSGARDPNSYAALLRSAARRVAPLGWHVQTFVPTGMIASLREVFESLPVPVVFDHFGGATAGGVDQPGFDALCRLLGGGRCYVKLSAPYHISSDKPDYPEVLPLARAFVKANPERLLWGSDWPHTNAALHPGQSRLEPNPFYDVDDANLLERLAVWSPDPRDRHRILVDTPATLFGD